MKPHRSDVVAIAVAALFLVGLAHAKLKQVFPHVWVDVAAKIVEFDGRVPIVVNDADASVVYLEVIVCAPDTKEHESLVVSKAKPSQVHAALLMIGMKPGKPGFWTWTGKGKDATLTAHDPAGDAVNVSFVWKDADGKTHVDRPSDWTINQETGTPLPEGPFVFAGSRMIDRGYGGEKYDADGTGLLVGLATFGSETIAWGAIFSPDSDVAEPVWAANPKSTPPVDTPVRVRITPRPQ